MSKGIRFSFKSVFICAGITIAAIAAAMLVDFFPTPVTSLAQVRNAGQASGESSVVSAPAQAITPAQALEHPLPLGAVTSQGVSGNPGQRKESAAGPLDSGNPLFLPPGTYGTGGEIVNCVEPRSLAVTDVNGDGKPDLIVANYGDGCGSGGSVGVLLGNGDGTFRPVMVTNVGQFVGASVAVGDVNGDGKPDLIIPTCCESNGDNMAAVLLGNGDGTFRAPVFYDSGGNQGGPLAVADLTGNGKLDIVVANWAGSLGAVGVLLGNGDGTFQPAMISNSPVDPGCLVIADVNNDGKPDLVIESANEIGVALGNGDGTFQPFTYYYTGYCDFLAVQGVAVADVNGDGVPDLLVANTAISPGACGSEAFAGVLLGNGDGTFQPEVNYDAGGEGPGGVAVADVNGDGKPDVVVTTGDNGPGSASVLLGNGDGTFQAAILYSTGGYNPGAVVAADLNRDGRPDLVVVNVGSENVGVLLNNTAPLPGVSLSPTSLNFPTQLLGTASAPQAVTLTNTGTASLTISTVTVGGTNPSDFTKSADTCTGATLTPTSTCTVSVTFTPLATGSLSAALIFTDNNEGVTGSTQTVSLAGSSTTAPTVTFTGAPASAAYNSTFTVAATTNASTTAVITASGACSVAGNTVTMTSGTGTCNLTATWAADSNYSAATATQTTPAQPAAQTITFAPPASPAVYNTSFSVAPTASSGLVVSMAAGGVCSISGVTVTMTSGTGACTLTASQGGNSNYSAAANVVQTVTAQKAAPKVTFTGAPASAVYNSSFGVASTTNASTTAVITASGSCSIAGNTVTMTSGAGPCTLTATWAADNNYNAATASQSTAATKAASTTAITANSPNPSSVGQAVTVSFRVSGNGAPTGSVTVNASTGETCSGPLTAGAGSCSIVFNSAGARTLTASYPGDNNFAGGASTAANQTVNGGGTGSLVSLSSPGLSFGNEPLSTTSTPQVETVTNTGNASLSISAVTVGGTNAGDFAKSLDTCTGATVKPNGTCTVSVAFTPTALGNRSASLNFADNAANSPQTVALSGTGVQGAVLNPPALIFGSQAENTSSARQTVTLTNTQFAALGISSVATSGDFTQTNTCGGSVPARSTCRISVTYTPTLMGGETGTLTVTDGASNSPQTVSLSGTGVAQAAVSPTSLLFSAQPLGITSPPWNVLLTNNLSTPLPISITLTGIDPGDFAQTNTCSGSVAAKSSCTISVTFKPVWTGTRVAALNVNSSANNSPQTVALSGFGD